MYQEARKIDWLSRPLSRDIGEREETMEGTNFELVGDFMQAFGQQVEEQPTWPDFNTRELRVDLIQEEVDELVEAIGNKGDMLIGISTSGNSLNVILTCWLASS